jgi:hypothetical protein
MQHLREQNWLAVAIDVIFFVTGVFIGIQAANWNDAWVTQVREHGFLERIAADLEADSENFRDGEAFWTEVSAYGERGLA